MPPANENLFERRIFLRVPELWVLLLFALRFTSGETWKTVRIYEVKTVKKVLRKLVKVRKEVENTASKIQSEIK